MAAPTPASRNAGEIKAITRQCSGTRLLHTAAPAQTTPPASTSAGTKAGATVAVTIPTTKTRAQASRQTGGLRFRFGNSEIPEPAGECSDLRKRLDLFECLRAYAIHLFEFFHGAKASVYPAVVDYTFGGRRPHARQFL